MDKDWHSQLHEASHELRPLATLRKMTRYCAAMKATRAWGYQEGYLRGRADTLEAVKPLVEALQDALDNVERCHGCHSATCPSYYSDELSKEICGDWRKLLTDYRKMVGEHES